MVCAKGTARAALGGIVLAVGLLAPSPNAVAGSLDAGLVVVEVANGHEAGCMPQVLTFCVIDVDTVGPISEWNINTTQRFSYVGVAIDPFYPIDAITTRPSAVSEPWSFEREVHASEIDFPNPTMPAVTELWYQVPFVHSLPDGMGFYPNEKNLSFRYYNIPAWNGQGTPPMKHYSIAYDAERGRGYNQTGLQNNVKGTTFHNAAYDGPEEAGCGPVNHTDPCQSTIHTIAVWGRNTTPDGAYGAGFYDIEAATDPELLDPPRPPPAEDEAQAAAASPIEEKSSVPPVIVEGGEGFAPGGPSSQEAAFSLPGRAPAPAAEKLAPAPQPSTPETAMATTSAPGTRGDSVDARLLSVLAGAGLGLFLAWSLLYSRITSRREALVSERRQRLAVLVRAQPGISWKEAAAVLGVTRNGLGYHVEVLAKAKVLRVQARGRERFLFAIDAEAGLLPPSPQFRSAVQARVLAVLREAPGGLTRQGLQLALGSTPERTRRRAVAALLEASLVREVPTVDGGSRLILAYAAPAPQSSPSLRA